MDTFLNTNNSKNKDLREANPRRSRDEEEVVITFSGIPLFQIFVSKSYLHLRKCSSRRGGNIGH